MQVQVSREDFSCAAPTNTSAYRRVTVPVLKVAAGPGPAVALIGGVHGDEWEGQAAVLELWHRLPAALRRGTVYLVPAANAEASLRATRLSPSDGGNLNRAFLGPPARGYTEAVAEALEQRILGKVQTLIDVHSGGASLRYLPSSVITRHGDAGHDPRVAELARAFGLPHCVFFHSREQSSMPAAAARRGVARLSAEIGGGNETSGALVGACRDGLMSCLALLGMVEAAHHRPVQPALYDLSAPVATRVATEPGVYFPTRGLGEEIEAGGELARWMHPTRPHIEPGSILAAQSGTVVCLRALASCEAGDCLAQVAPGLPFDTLAGLY